MATLEMKPFLLKTFNLKPEEGLKFTLLFFHSFFLGLFIAFYFVTANAVFIDHYDSKMVPVAYLVAGISGYLMTSIYSYMQKRVNSLVLFLTALSFMLVIPLAGRLGLNFFDEQRLSFFVFIWGWPFISLVGIESGGLALRFFNLRQVKRLFGLVNMGGVIASIIGYLVIPVLLRHLGHAYDLLYFGAVSVLVSVVMLLLIYKNFSTETTQMTSLQKPKDSEKKGFLKLSHDRYYALIFLSACFSMTVIYIMDFGFLATTKSQISDPAKLSYFLSIVFAALKIGELILSYFSGRILSNRGVKLGLTILPVTLSLLLVGALASELVSSVASVGFFAFMVLGKSLERIIRRALDDPAFNILYQLLPDDEKLSVQTRVGVIMQLSISIAGGVLWLFTEIFKTPDQGFDLYYFPFIFLPILLAWSFIAFKLYKRYKLKLRDILEERNRKKAKQVHRDIYGSDVLSNELKTERDIESLRLAVTILSETNPRNIEPHAAHLLRLNDSTIRKAILSNINPSWTLDVKAPIQEILARPDQADEETLELAQLALCSFDYADIEAHQPEQILAMVDSNSIRDRITVVKYLFYKELPDDERVIFRLLEDPDKTIRQAAIRLAGKARTPALTRHLVHLIETPEFHHITGSTLVELGEEVLPELNGLVRPAQDAIVIKKVIEIGARIGTLAAKEMLLALVNYPDKEVQRAVIQGLYFCHFQVTEEQAPVVKKKIQEVVGNILWAYVTISDIEAEKNTLKLVQAIDLERENEFELLFTLLSFVYQPATIELIKTNIIGENIIFALEIIDNFIAQDVKQLIIPIIDKVSVNQRAKKLKAYFNFERMRLAERLKDIILEDYSRVDMWSKNKAIELLAKLFKGKKSQEIKAKEEDTYRDVPIWTKEEAADVLSKIRRSEIPDEIFLCLHHADELVYSTAAKIIYDEHPVTCVNHLKKLSPVKQEMIEILENSMSDLLLERVKLLKRIPLFFRLPENTLVKLAKLFKSQTIGKEGVVMLVNQDGSENIYIILRGKMFYKKHDKVVSKFTNRDIVVRGLNVELNAREIFSERNTTLLAGNRFSYFNLLVDETEIIRYMFEVQQPSGKK